MNPIPEIPPPWRPEEPEPWPPPAAPPARVPFVELPETAGARRARRTVLLSGPLDGSTATEICARLMALDGESGDDVRLVVNSDGGPLDAALPVLEVIGLMRARVDATCVGVARGTAAVLLACATGRRLATPSAVISLRCAHREVVEGSVEELQRRAAELAAMRARLRDAVVLATGIDVAQAEALLDGGDALGADEALQLGLVDGVAGARGEDRS